MTRSKYNCIYRITLNKSYGAIIDFIYIIFISIRLRAAYLKQFVISPRNFRNLFINTRVLFASRKQSMQTTE